MTAKDKIKYTIQLIDNARQIAPKGHICWIEHETIDKTIVTPLELHSILLKLQIEEGIIDMVDSPFSNGVRLWSFDNIQPKTFALKVLPAFEKYEMIKT
jgi:hypothetical protein